MPRQFESGGYMTRLYESLGKWPASRKAYFARKMICGWPWVSQFFAVYIISLTTNAIFLSDLSETFISDSSN